MSHSLKQTIIVSSAIALLALAGNAAHAENIQRVALDVSPSQKQTELDKGTSDVIARVGNEIIEFSMLNTMLNSSPMVGLSIPALGSPERRQVIITLLDRAISANLLYLEAMQKKVDQDPAYLNEINAFEDAILASLYKRKNLLGNIEISGDEIRQFHQASIEGKEELTDDKKHMIEARLRKQKITHLKQTLRQRLRQDVTVAIEESVLDSFLDDKRKDDDIVATIDGDAILWGKVKAIMRGADQRSEKAAFYLDEQGERKKRLDQQIDTRIMANKARAAGLESDPDFMARIREYRKTSLVNFHRGNLLRSWQPDENQIRDFFQSNRNKIAIPEIRKIQMILVKTEQEAMDIKARIESGEITMFQAARDFSIDPRAKTTLGEMGWVAKDTGFEDLDIVTFSLEPEVISDPVESPSGWHLVKVLDVQDAQRDSDDDPQAYGMALRMYLRGKLNDHVTVLRKEAFTVEVYQDDLVSQFEKEEQYIKQLTRQAEQENSLTKQREKEIERLIN